jgi:hypothetical protein
VKSWFAWRLVASDWVAGVNTVAKRFAGTRGKGKAIIRQPKIGENRGPRRFNALARRASKTMNG